MKIDQETNYKMTIIISIDELKAKEKNTILLVWNKKPLLIEKEGKNPSKIVQILCSLKITWL